MRFEHIVLHKGTDYHSAFPEIIRLQNGDLVAVFRQAPVREGTGVQGERNARVSHFHADPGSRIVVVRSTDDGLTWDNDSLVVVDPPDGVQDHNLAMVSQVSSGELIVNNHRWFFHLDAEGAAERGVSEQPLPDRPNPPFNSTAVDSLYIIRSGDNGYTWGEPKRFGVPSMTYNSHTGKSGVVELPDGTWLLPLHGHTAADQVDRVYVARSEDDGRTWGQPSTVAYDPDQVISVHEPPMLRLSTSKLLTVMRTDGADGYLYQAFSNDDGWTWQGLKRTPIWGGPCQLLELRSGRILCTYGYRREPFGIRAAFSDDEGESWDMDRQVIIRDDGMHLDLGYPASIQLNDGRVLSVYYFHGEDGIRFIGGSIWSEEEALG